MIRTLSVEVKYTRNVHRVVITPEQRAQYTDQQIINIVDQYGDESYADRSCNFGGVVKAMPFQADNVYEVTVYTD